MFAIIYHNDHLYDHAASAEAIVGPYDSREDALHALADLQVALNENRTEEDGLFELDADECYLGIDAKEHDIDLAGEVWAEIVPLHTPAKTPWAVA